MKGLPLATTEWMDQLSNLSELILFDGMDMREGIARAHADLMAAIREASELLLVQSR